MLSTKLFRYIKCWPAVLVLIRLPQTSIMWLLVMLFWVIVVPSLFIMLNAVYELPVIWLLIMRLLSPVGVNASVLI